MSQRKNLREAMRAIEATGLRVIDVRHDSKTRIVTDRGIINLPESPSQFNLGVVRRTALKMAKDV